MNDNSLPGNGARLKALLRESGLKSTRLDVSRRLVIFSGRTRDWTFNLSMYNGWLHIHTYVCEIPELTGLRSQVLDIAMTANTTMSLTKFSKAGGLLLELEYRDEHLDGKVLSNLLSLTLHNAEEYYPRLFRTVTGDAVLDALAAPNELSEAA